MNAPVTLPSKAEALHDRRWWAAQSARVGSDWQTIDELAARVLFDLALTPCPTCERAPCQTPSFCGQCREQDQENAAMSNDQFDNRNRGVLFNERDKKTTDKDRDYGGSININGVEYWLSAWIRTSKKGTKFLSLSVKPKDETKSSHGGGSPKRDMDDEIPF